MTQTFGGSTAGAYGINSRGSITGTARAVDEQDQAFSGSLALDRGNGSGINDLGTVVGTLHTDSGPRAAVWEGAVANLVPGLGGPTSFGAAIAGSGAVAGAAETVTGALHAFVHAGGITTDIGHLGGDWSSAYAINSVGDQIAGTSMNSSGDFKAFTWTAASGMRELGTLGGRTSYAMAINASGAAAGSAATSSGALHAFVHDPLTGMRDLGTLGGLTSHAYGLNASGMATGYSYLANGQGARGFVWTNGVLFDLNSLIEGANGWIIDAAYAINDTGQIAGSGTFGGKRYAVRLDPVAADVALQAATVPEPSTYGLALVGVALILAGGYRNRINSVVTYK